MTLTVGLVLAGGLLAFAGRAWVQHQAPRVIPPWVTLLEAVREVGLPLLLVVPATQAIGAWAWLAAGAVVGVAGIRLARDARIQAQTAEVGRRELEARRVLRRASPPEVVRLSTPITTSPELADEERRTLRALRDAMAGRG